MSSKDNNGEMMGIALVIAVMWVAILFVYAVAVFAAFVLTGIALYAWNEPRKVFGSVLTPEEARTFVGRGIIGAIGVPVFALFCGAMFQIRIEDQYWLHIILGGYAFGSLGIAMMEGETQAPELNFNGMTIEAEPARPAQSNERPASPRRDEEPAFQFASWDDEEELGR